ncbi:MAG: succinate dehydrogenase iron-sulfur subunit [Chloroflexota bacterium]|jgi:fumarate reductase iron-sulfur subunit|nr:succinate dehydrogenase iron-sulfur subunit [Chloroflexota bacterium]MDP6757266.1 succinate dehydrogenase iron-sulfur subunit [Chloroflexota bacterium]
MGSKVTFEVFRFDSETEESSYQDFEMEYEDEWVILDGLNYIKGFIDGSLSHRWSCRMGVCGSCGMIVNGYPTLTCSTFIRDYLPGPIRVEPLTNFKVERDLIVNLDDFLRKLQQISPWIVRDEERAIEHGEYLQTPAELATFKQFTLCINCMLCYSACPVVSHELNFIGPAVLTLGHRYNLDSRDQGADMRLDEMLSSDGIWSCTFVGECSQVCPKHVDPAGAIQQSKVSGVMAYFKSFVMSSGSRE